MYYRAESLESCHMHRRTSLVGRTPRGGASIICAFGVDSPVSISFKSIARRYGGTRLTTVDTQWIGSRRGGGSTTVVPLRDSTGYGTELRSPNASYLQNGSNSAVLIRVGACTSNARTYRRSNYHPPSTCAVRTVPFGSGRGVEHRNGFTTIALIAFSRASVPTGAKSNPRKVRRPDEEAHVRP